MFSDDTPSHLRRKHVYSEQWTHSGLNTMARYTLTCMLYAVGLLPLCSGAASIRNAKGCYAELPSGLVNLQPLAQTDGHPRFTSSFAGVNFSFNPCLPIFEPDSNAKALLTAKIGHLSNNSMTSYVLGTTRSALFKPVTHHRLSCHSKHIVNTCPIAQILHKRHRKLRSLQHNVRSISKTDSMNVHRVEVKQPEDDVDYDEGSSAEDDDDDDGEDEEGENKDNEKKEDAGAAEDDGDGVLHQDNVPKSSTTSPYLTTHESYPENVTAIIRLGSKWVCHGYKVLVLLQCNQSATLPSDATFNVLHTSCPEKLYFLLSHRCCCPGACTLVSTSTIRHAAMPPRHKPDVVAASKRATNGDTVLHQGAPVVVQTIDNATLLEVSVTQDVEPMPKFMWLILVVNAGVLTSAITIAGVCCRKGPSAGMVSQGGAYNYLPDFPSLRQQALHSSRHTIGSSMESCNQPRLPQPKAAEYLDYTSDRMKSARVPLLENCIISAGDLDFRQRLGGGLFGDTYVCNWKDRVLAAKRITVGVHQSQLTAEHYEWLEQEVKRLSKARHKHLAGVIGVVKDTRQAYILNEYIAGDTLKDILHINADKLTWHVKIKMCIQIADGLAYLHSSSPPVLHRDLRCSNIIIDKYAKARIVDFGMTKMVQKLRQACNGRKGCFCKKEMSALPGNIRWTAPELLENPQADEDSGDIITPACDIYSYALLLWEVSSHCEPFEDVPDENEVMELIQAGVRPRVDILVGAIPHLRDVMVTCWDDNPENRPSAKQVVYKMKECLQVVNKMSSRPRSRESSATHYLKSALNIANV